jgi:PAS domain S-box-containing protein
VGAERGEVVGRPFWETPWWEQTESARELVQRSIAAAGRGEFVRFETTMRGVGGRPIAVDFSLKPVRDERGEIVMLLPEGRDITVLKDAQRRETHMLKALAAIGESASVLAHEIKNPITGIHLAIQAVADQLGEDTREILHGLEDSLHKVERTMRRTLSFAKPLEVRLQSVAVPRLLETVARRARTELEPSSAALEIECETELPLLEADEALLDEALLNLVKNALEALESGGRVRMTARRAERRALELSIEDDGPGIPDYVLPSVFKPFYTTKEKGTGIGLALCKKIVDAHGGEIRAGRSTLGGAAFTIRMPVA